MTAMIEQLEVVTVEEVQVQDKMALAAQPVRLVVKRAALRKALDTIAPAFRKSKNYDSLPILQSLKIEQVGPARCRAWSTDLTISISTDFDVEEVQGLREAGGICLMSQDLLGAIVAAPASADTVVITIADANMFAESEFNDASVQIGNTFSSIQFMEVEAYPVGQLGAPSVLLATIQAHTLKALLGNVLYAASKDETRPVLTGVAFQLRGEDSTVLAAAADSFRLAARVEAAQVEVTGRDGDEKYIPPVQKFIIPAEDAVAKLVKMLPDTAEKKEGSGKNARTVNTTFDVQVRHVFGAGPTEYMPEGTMGSLVFSCAQFIFVASLIEGNFPSMGNVFAGLYTCGKHEITIDKSELLEALKWIIAVKPKEVAWLTIAGEGNEVVFSTQGKNEKIQSFLAKTASVYTAPVELAEGETAPTEEEIAQEKAKLEKDLEGRSKTWGLFATARQSVSVQYFLDAVQHVESTKVVLSYDGHKPLMVRSADEEALTEQNIQPHAGAFRQIIMPFHLANHR